MSNEAPPAPTEAYPTPQWQPPKRHRVRNTILATVGGLVLVGAGIGIGSAANNKTSQLNTAHAQLNTARAQISADRSKIGSLQDELSTNSAALAEAQTQMAAAQSQAQHALSTATAKVKTQDAARQAQLNQQAATLKQQAKTISAEEGTLQANQITTDGMYVVGKDIKSGTWHTPGDGGQTDQECYYQTDNTSNLSSISNIGSNANFDGPETVSVSGYYAFEVNGPCTWYLTG